MIIKTPEIKSEIYPTWEKVVDENPHLKNSPEIVKKNYEDSVEELFAAIIFLSTF
ncbi:MAG: hypothetical protein GX363_05255 [Clostridiales bacterium]|jgi:hypothetical protein|nr:hypothetical protein [Clostridiales bacterium]